ncbi:MAG TPA: hypothetical protein VF184_13290 [Phycisphaeraceae bacterium]
MMPTAWFFLAQAQAPSPPGTERFDLTIFQRYWGSQTLIPVRWIVLALGLLMLMLASLAAYRWWRGWHSRSHPLVVFYHLARASGLGLSDQWLLHRIAHQQALPSPLTLMLSPRTLHRHARAYAAEQPPWRRVALMRRVLAIRRRLFGPWAPTDPQREAA